MVDLKCYLREPKERENYRGLEKTNSRGLEKPNSRDLEKLKILNKHILKK